MRGYPEGESWVDYHCTDCGTDIFWGCSCEAKKALEQKEDDLADRFGPEFVTWLRAEDFDIMDDEFVPVAAFMLMRGEIAEYDDGVDLFRYYTEVAC